jgi:concanavalin A-like lectin/glucanase superfamily protein
MERKELKLLVCVLAISLMAQAGTVLAVTADDVEALVEADSGIGAITTYLDFTKTGVGDTREGLSLVTADDTWNYPDTSDSALWVNANCLDEKDDPANDFLGTISGLTPNTECTLYVVAAGRKIGSGVGTFDFSWGTSGDGSAVNTVSGVYNAPDAVYVAEVVGASGEITASMAVPIGVFTSDANGDLAIWIGKGEAFSNDKYRTELDGLVVGEFEFNFPPQVGAGSCQSLLWTETAQLCAAVSDDGNPADPGEVTLTWSQISGPGTADFTDTTIEDPCVTFDAAGTYELRLSADDGEKDACDVVVILARAGNNLVAHWAFDDDSGTTVLDSVGNNDGTLAGEDPNWVSGWVGSGALEFYGEVAPYLVQHSYVDITIGSAPDPNLNNLQFGISLAAWVKVSDIQGWHPIIIAKGNNSWQMGLSTEDPVGRLYVSYEGTEGTSVYSTTLLNDGYWHHVVGVYDGAMSYVYVDGRLEGSSERTGLIDINDLPVTIGARATSATEVERSWNGLIDDVRVYDYGISAAEVLELVAMGQGTVPIVDIETEDQTFYMQNGCLQLAARVVDDGDPVAAVIEWTKISDPCTGDVEFSDASIEDPTVTFFEAGTYVLRLTADNGVAEVYDEVTITVENPTCQDIINDGLLMTSDVSGPDGTPDCRVNLYDFAALAGEWLGCNDPQNDECELPY